MAFSTRSHNCFAQLGSISFFLSSITIVGLIFASGGAVFAQTMPADEAIVRRLDSAIAAHVANGFTGSVLIAHHGQVIVDKSYGVSVKADSHPIYWLASNSKPILALAIMKLQEQGRLSVDDRITKFFKNVPSDKKEITLTNLLTHTSGLPHMYVAEGVTDRNEAVDAVLKLSLQYKIGDGWHYANTNYYLLAAIVEIASGKTFEQYIRSSIFDPVGLRDTGFWGFEENRPILPPLNLSRMNSLKPTIFKNGRSVANWGYRGATGLFSTTADLYKLFTALRNEAILSRESIDQMWAPLVFIRHDPSSDVYSGLGWYISMRGGKRTAVRHTGSEDALGHNGVIWFYENGDALVVLSNSGERNGSGMSAALSSDLSKVLTDLN